MCVRACVHACVCVYVCVRVCVYLLVSNKVSAAIQVWSLFTLRVPGVYSESPSNGSVQGGMHTHCWLGPLAVIAVCVCVCVCACMRACVRVCVHMCVCTVYSHTQE